VLSTEAAFTRTAASLTLGTHNVYLKARDDEGTWSQEVSTTLTIDEEPMTAPMAAFTVTPAAGPITTVFTVDASGSSDGEDELSALEVRWDWEDDGAYDTDWRVTKTATHTYAVSGTHTVRLEVRDTDGMTDTATRLATVTALAEESAWLFILYLDGDNNLHSWMRRALRKLEEAELGDDLTMVALFDSSGNNGTWRYHIQPGGSYIDGLNRWDMGELDMSDPRTLSDFVTWARSNYPARHTYLAVADHGQGIAGIAWDETTGEDELITVAELRTALQDATSDGAAPLDVVHYDACLMAMVENAYQIEDYAAYLVASQNLGWSLFAYDRYAAQVTADTTSAQLASAVVDEYFEALGEYPRTISAVDLARVGAVSQTLSTLASALRADLDGDTGYISETLGSVQRFDSRDYLEIDDSDEYVDVYDFARLIQHHAPSETVRAAAQDVMDAVVGFVVAERHESGVYRGNRRWDLDRAHGTSIYFPPAPGGWGYEDYMGGVFRFTAEGTWDEFLQDYLGLVGTPPVSPTNPGTPPVLEVPYVVYLPVVVR
jgi:PKD repeat protein